MSTNTPVSASYHSIVVVINPCVLSANRFDSGLFLFHKFSNFTPPPPLTFQECFGTNTAYKGSIMERIQEKEEMEEREKITNIAMSKVEGAGGIALLCVILCRGGGYLRLLFLFFCFPFQKKQCSCSTVSDITALVSVHTSSFILSYISHIHT